MENLKVSFEYIFGKQIQYNQELLQNSDLVVFQKLYVLET